MFFLVSFFTATDIENVLFDVKDPYFDIDRNYQPFKKWPSTLS